jgi:HipA-like protein
VDTRALRTVRATKYVTPFREGGSLPGLVEADDDGLYVVKFHGAAQGPRALVAEVLAGELARALGLPVPELVLVDIDPALGGLDGDPWVGELLERSPGRNVGVDFLPGSLTFNPRADGRPDPELAADVVWFDALVTNTDRSPRNPNILAWHRRLYLIDHGASLFIHHTWRDPIEHARRPLDTIADHVMLPFAASLDAAHARLAPLVTEPLLRAIAGLVPGEWLLPQPIAGDSATQRDAYVAYLLERVATPAALVDAIEGLRRAA